MAADPAGWIRNPTVHGNTIVFACEEGLFKVPVTGGTAVRLTSGLGVCARPAFSPDGQTIAFDGTEEGVREVYVMDAAGGAPRRLTWHGESANVIGCLPDGRVAYVTAVNRPFFRDTHAFAVAVQGGAPTPLPYGPLTCLAVRNGKGETVLGRHTADLAWWKGYRGGRMGVLWARQGDAPFVQLAFPFAAAMPTWLGDRLYFVGDPGGLPQLVSCKLGEQGAEDVVVHTSYTDLAVRFPASDGTSLVYCHGGDLHRFDAATGLSERIPVAMRTQRPALQRRFVHAHKHLEDFDVHPDGHSLLLTARGRPFAMGHWEGPVRQLGVRDGVRYRLARWVDGETALVASDAGGEEALETVGIAATGVHRRYDGLDHGRIMALEVDPTGLRAAFMDHRNRLYVLELAAGSLVELDRSDSGPLLGFDWSPDGRWLAWAIHVGVTGRSCIRLCPVDEESEGKRFVAVDVTSGEYYDHTPSFDPAGQHLYFLSMRDFNPINDSHYFGYAFARGMRPYLVTLSATDEDPFQPAPRPLKGGPKPADRAERVEVDLEGIADRLVPFPIAEARYEDIVGVGQGQVLLTRAPVRGTLDRSFFSPGPPKADVQLLSWDFDKQELVEINGRISGFRVDRKREHVVLRAGYKLRVLPARPDKGQREEFKKHDGSMDRKGGFIDLSRLRVSVDPASEWRQMLREAWRLMRDHFWQEALGGKDWPGVHARYDALLPRMATRGDLSDLIWCLQGELGTSHAYEMGGDYLLPPSYRLGRLGADFAWDADARGWRISRILEGDTGDRERSSPLRGPGRGALTGALVTHVDGVELDAHTPPEAALVHKSGMTVALAIGGENPRELVVRTLKDDRALRYRDWVNQQRKHVHEATGGRVGYVHIPDMGPPGFAEFHRDFEREYDRDGLIVDVRFNRGGHVSQLLLARLQQPRLGYMRPRWGRLRPYPVYSVAGPMVALTNELAGSDGDIFSHAWKCLQLGPLVGTRTWGGVVGIWPRQTLVDGAVTTQPEYANWFANVGFGLENHGAEPDVVVDITPDDHAAGRDPQMARGLAIMEELLATTPRLPGPPQDR